MKMLGSWSFMLNMDIVSAEYGLWKFLVKISHSYNSTFSVGLRLLLFGLINS